MGLFRRNNSAVDKILKAAIDDKKRRKAVIKKKNEYSDLATEYSEIASDKAAEYFDLAYAKLQEDEDLRKQVMYVAAALIAVGMVMAVKKSRSKNEEESYEEAR